MKRFDSTTDPIAFKEAKKRTPVITPYSFVGAAGAALAGAFVVFVFVGLIAIADGHPVRVPLKWAGITGLVVYGIVQLILPLVLYETETITGHDLNRDGHIGPPPLPQPSLNVELHRAPRQMRLADLPGPPEVICEWAAAAVARRSTAYAAWEPRFGEYVDANGQKVELYRRFREVITEGDRPLAVERGTHGLMLTDEGKQLFGALARDGLRFATPLLDAQGAEINRLEPPTNTNTPVGEGA